MELIRITNPNPRPVAIWRGDKLQDLLGTHDQLLTPITDDMRITSPKRALVVLEHDDMEWVQEVGPRPVIPDQKQAYVRQDRREGVSA